MFIGVRTLGKEQFVIFFTDKIIFQSYDTVVAFIDKLDPMGEVLYYTPKKYSKTTSKYFNMFKHAYHFSNIYEICDEHKFKEKLNETCNN